VTNSLAIYQFFSFFTLQKKSRLSGIIPLVVYIKLQMLISEI